MHKPTAAEIQQFIRSSFVPHENDPVLQFESVQDAHARVRLEVQERHLRPGATISGPMQMMLADAAAWILIVHNLGLAAAASVTSNLNISFLARPPHAPLIAEATMLKLGKRLSVSEVRIFSEGTPEMVAHATVTYAVITG